MVIQHNLPAMNSHRQMGINNNQTSKNLEKLSSGYRVNRAGDDAAGLAISEKMRGQIRGLNMATQNANNGISLIQTAEGGLNETHDILQRMRELAVQSANGTYQDDTDRENLTKEIDALMLEIDRISTATNYNGISLLDGSLDPGAKVTDKTAAAYKVTAGALPADTSSIDDGVNTATFSLDADGALQASGATLSASTTGGAIDTATFADGTSFTFDADKITADLTKGGEGATVAVNLVTTKAVDQAAAVAGTANAGSNGTAALVGSHVFQTAGDDDKLTGHIDTTIATIASIVDPNGSMTDSLDLKLTYGAGGGSDGAGTLSVTAEGWTVTGTSSGFILTNDADNDLVVTLGDLSSIDTLTKLNTAASGNATTLTDLNAGFSVETSLGFNAGTPEVEAKDATVTVASGKTPATALPTTATAAEKAAATPAAKLTTPPGTGSPLTFQIGANGSEDQQVSLTVADMSSAGLGISGISVGKQDEANKAIDLLDKAINTVSGTRADLGALQNRLEHTVNNLGTTKENLQAAESSIRDVDMAKEMMEFTKNNILVQASQSMLAQSNQLPQGVLQLLR